MSLSESIVVGIYGIQGVGKSYVLKQCAKERMEWHFVDGSQLIREVLHKKDKTLEYFQNHMIATEKADVRKAAIERAKTKPGLTLIAGHCSFPSSDGVGDDGSIQFKDVFTEADGAVYDLIIYLEKQVDEVSDQIENDKERVRSIQLKHVLQKWVEHEKALLKAKCSEYNIDFHVLSSDTSWDHNTVMSLIVDKIVVPASIRASVKSEHELVASIKKDVPAADVYLLIDGDGTICPQDTGTMFFDHLSRWDTPGPLQKIFKRYKNYCFQAFWEVSMLYSNASTTEQYASLCDKIGRETQVYPAWCSFLEQLPDNVHPIIVSSSIREVWLAMQSYQAECSKRPSMIERMSIIAGNNLSLHPYIVDDNAKSIVVRTLRELNGGCRIVSFGDSVLDVPMLCESDHSFVVVTDKMNRSMKDFISKGAALGHSNPRLSQLIDLDPSTRAQMWHDGLPIQTLWSLLGCLKTNALNVVIDCTSSSVSAQQLSAQMRDASLYGPCLHSIHEEVGKLLADRVIDQFGLLNNLVDNAELPHVQGGTFTSLSSATIKNVMVLPLMRGGEPMARGVFSRFPSAQFIHFYDREDEIDERNGLLSKALEQLNEKKPVNIVITDSVINSGSSIKRAIMHIHRAAQEISTDMQLVFYVLSGVMQEEAANLLPRQFPRVRWVTLRVSKNKYTGKGGTDTGNRLFGTTLID